MPTPDYKSERQMPDAFLKMLGDKSRQEMPDLAHEIHELRKEINALREELAPVPSLILTGRQVLDEFKKLTQGE